MAFRTQRYGIQTELRGARGVITNLNAIARALDATRLAATKTFEIDRQIRTIGVQAGATSKEISRLSMMTAGLSQATGVSIDKTTELITAYQSTGRVLGEFTGHTGKVIDQFDAMSTSGAKNYQMMTELVGRFGIGAKAAVQMERAIEHLIGPRALEGLLDKTVEFQQQFRMPGMIASLPRVVGFADKALSDFGESVASNSQEIIYNTLKMGATYAQTFGVDAAEGISKAMEIQRRFLQQSKNDLNVFLGIADDFDPLTKALQETGLGLEHVQSLTRLGQEDPIEYAKVIRSMYQQLGGENSLYAQRFLENVRKSSSEGVQKLISNEQALTDAIHARDEAARNEVAIKGFTTMVDSVRSVGSELLNTISRLAQLSRTIIGLTFVEDFSEPLGGAVDVLKRFNAFLADTAQKVKNSDWFKEWKPRIQGLGKVLLALGAAAGVVATTFAAMIIPFQTAVSLIRAIPIIGNAAGGAVDRLTGAVITFGKGIVRPAGILAGLATAFNDFGAALKDPSISQRPLEVLVRGLRAVSLGVVNTFDNLLFGIPTTIAKWFYPKMRGTLGDVVKRVFTDLQLYLERGAAQVGGSWWDAFSRTVDEKVNLFYNYLIDNRERFVAQAREWGQNIGRAIGTLAKWAWDGISTLLDRNTWSRAWDQITDYFSGEGGGAFKSAWGGALGSVLELAAEFTTNMFDEVLRPWGSGWIEVKQKFTIFWEYAKLGFDWFQNVGLPSLEAKWLSFKITLVDTFYAIKDGAEYAFSYIAGAATQVVGNLAKAAYGVAVLMKETTKFRAEQALRRELVDPRRLLPASTAAYQAWQKRVSDRQNDLAQVNYDIGQLELKRDSYARMAAEGERKANAAGGVFALAQQSRRSRVDAIVGEDRKRLDQLSDASLDASGRPRAGTLAAGQAAYALAADRTQARLQEIQAGDLPRLEARERERRRDLAQRQLDATELQRVRPGLISPLDKLVSGLESRLETAKGTGLQPHIEALLDSARNARAGVREAGSAQQATDQFNQFMRWLDEHYQGVRQKLGGEDAGLGARNYQAPPTVPLEPAPTPTQASASVGGAATAPAPAAPTATREPLSYQGFSEAEATETYSRRAPAQTIKIVADLKLDADDSYRYQMDRDFRIMTGITHGF
ncbi:MAG: hypothetical protein AB7L09_00305 [Nitrospira sp.]